MVNDNDYHPFNRNRNSCDDGKHCGRDFHVANITSKGCLSRRSRGSIFSSLCLGVKVVTYDSPQVTTMRLLSCELGTSVEKIGKKGTHGIDRAGDRTQNL